MSGIEKEREKLEINRLNSNERSEMFREFRKAGGKIVEIKENGFNKQLSRLETLVKQSVQNKTEEERGRKKLQSNDELAKRLDAYLDEKEDPSNQKKQIKKKKAKIEAHLTKLMAHKKPPNPLVKPFNVFLSRFICFLSGIFPFFKLKFTQSFINQTLFDFKTALKNLNPILTPLIYSDKTFSRQLREELTGMGLNDYFELIYRISGMLDENVFANLSKTMIAPKNSVKLSEKSFLKLYKTVYVLYDYRNALKDAVETALKIEQKIKNLQESVLFANISYVKKNINFVFSRFLPKFNQLVDYYYKLALFHGWKKDFKAFIKISAEDEIGYYTRKWHEEAERNEQRRRLEKAKSKEAEKENEDKDPLQKLKEDTSIESSVKRGIEIIYWYLDFEAALAKFRSERDPNGVMKINDKIFLILNLLNFFDEEFSFLFVSQKVKYNVFFDHMGRRVDIKSQLKDHYFKLNGIYQKEREYLKVMNNLSALTHGFTIELNESLPEYERVVYQREQILRMIRYESRKVVDEFIEDLRQVVEDLKGERNILQLPEEMMVFESKLTAHRLCNHRTFADAFLMAYQVVSAIQYLLTDGELGGIHLEDIHPKYLKLPKKEDKPVVDTQTSVKDSKSGLPDVDIDDLVPNL